ncbi:MAG: hypothetical protein LBF12_01905 [Christensenellaceae bacterium]|jgi:hypothetical protein|nr:hypothetical protein [Christensenellaceae bacterium]
MNRKFKKFTAIICITISVLLLFIAIMIPLSNIIIGTGFKGGTVDDLLNSKSDITASIKNEYKGKFDVRIVLTKEKNLGSVNIRQKILNDKFNAKYGTTVGGTCSEVATTLLIKKFGRQKEKTYQYTFDTVMDIAIKSNLWTSNGTKGSDIDKLVTKSFQGTGSSRWGNNDYVGIYNTLANDIDNGYTTILSCIGHSMHAVGYIHYTVKYKTQILWLKIESTTIKKYVIVNDGWQDASTDVENKQYSYYPEESFVFPDFVLTKVKG